MRYNMFIYAPDDGGASGGGAEDDSTGGSDDLSERLSHVSASYENDLEEGLRGDDFSGIEDVGKLYKAYKEGKIQHEADKKALESSLKIPGKDAPYDEIKAFFTKIGMPEKAEDYNLSDFDMDPKEIANMKKNFMLAAHKSGLTKGQAASIWSHEMATYSAVKKGVEAEVENLRKTFDARFDAQLKEEIPDSTKRSERITRDKNNFTEFIGKAGLGEYFAKTGLDMNPAFIHQIAGFYEKYFLDAPMGSQGKTMTEQERLKKEYPSMFK